MLAETNWAACTRAVADHPITFHDHHLNENSSRASALHSTFLLTRDRASVRSPRLMQCMLRNYRFRATGEPGADPYARDVEFRCCLDSLLEADFNKRASTGKNNTFPVMVLEGPVRAVRMVKILCDHEGEKGCRQGLWEYP